MQSIQWCLWLWRMANFARSFEWKGRRRCHFWPLWLYLSVVTKVVTVDCDFKLAKFEEALDIPEVALDTDDRLLALVYLGTKGLSRTNMLNWQNFWKKEICTDLFSHFSNENYVFSTFHNFWRAWEVSKLVKCGKLRIVFAQIGQKQKEICRVLDFSKDLGR